jgi:hypothetical protein
VSRVRRDSVAGRAYLDVQNLARRTGRPTGELLHLYALEGFLDRLSHSEHADALVLKGGMLLAVWDARRPTRDIDLAARHLVGEVEPILAMVRHIARIDLGDGLIFEASEANADTIRDDDDYAGIRVSLPGRLDRAVFRFHVDLNFGDPIAPPPAEVEVPRLLGGEPVRMLGYPLVMVLAEKIVTMVERGQANTRWRDFADVFLLTARRQVDPVATRAAIAVVAGHRGVQMKGLADLTQTYPSLAQPRWSAWRKKQLLEDVLPEQFTDVLQAVSAFLDHVDPALGARPEQGS